MVSDSVIYFIAKNIEITFPEVKNAFVTWRDIHLNMRDGSVVNLVRNDFDWPTWVSLVTDVKKFFAVEEKF